MKSQKNNQKTLREAQANYARIGNLIKSEKKLKKFDESGMTAKERQDARNKEYFARNVVEEPIEPLWNGKVSLTERSLSTSICSTIMG